MNAFFDEHIAVLKSLEELQKIQKRNKKY